MTNHKISRTIICLFACLLLATRPASAADAPRAGIFTGKPDLAREISKQIEAAGYATEFIGPEVLTNSTALLSREFDLLVLPGAGSLPVNSMTPVENYLRRGGRLMALGLPAWSSPTIEVNGKWLSAKQCQELIDKQAADHPIVDISSEDFSKWKRSVKAAETKTLVEVASLSPTDNQKALHVTIENLDGWDVLVSPPLTNSFADGRALTCFRARGSEGTHEMTVEWDEQDGSRWIATIELSDKWKSYSLPPEAFRFWESSPGRGGAGDHLDVRHAVSLHIGLARSHSALPGPHHEYWIGNIGSACSPLGNATPPDPLQAPPIDTLSPGWKFYPMHGPLKVTTPDGLALVSPAEMQPPSASEMLPQAMQPRPRGIGFNQNRPWRWQPILEARSPDGDYRGAMATLMFHYEGEFRGGIWACFTSDDAAFYRQKPARQLLRQTALAIRRGLFLQEGGSEFFTVFENQAVPFGALAVNLGKTAQINLLTRITVKPKNGRETLFKNESPVDLIPGGSAITTGTPWTPPHWPEGGMIVTTELLQDGKVIDRLEHELNVWKPNPHPEFITERDGQCWWRGQPWKVNGVNYMPATGIGITSGDYFEQWLGQGAYDPEAIERDLRRIKAMNLNAVSIFVYRSSMTAQHWLDFQRRCRDLGLHVNQSLRPGTPLDFQWDKMKDLIEFYHLAENDTIFAYDLAWEAEHVNEQHYYGRDWTTWVEARYGSVARAETAWGVPAPPVDGTGILAVPPLRELGHDGPWRILAADYRAFLDQELDKRYGEARRLIRSIDPNHAVSFRMSEAGDPTLDSDQRLPFDFFGLARAVDIWEPEAYGRIGDWKHVREGRFEVDYARLCDPNKPLLWAEMGYPVWDERRGEASPNKLEFTAAFYRDFYRMMGQAGCDGVFFWWYPGGFRANEQSDFGIINPDGTVRPVTAIIREAGPDFIKAPRTPAPDYFIAIDRDRDARGLFGIYQAVKDDYWRAIAAGKTPALKWEKKPGEK